jgi:hypothetical protein
VRRGDAPGRSRTARRARLGPSGRLTAAEETPPRDDDAKSAGHLTVPRRCNGPVGSANGGYFSGALAAALGHATGPVVVALRAPPPLEHPVSLWLDGRRLIAQNGPSLIAEAEPTTLNVEVPASVSFAEAERAGASGRDEWLTDHAFPTCVVCGPERPPGDGLRLFPGPVSHTRLFAAPWIPDSSLATGDGEVETPWVWAALDCPSSAPVIAPGRGTCVLASFAVDLRGPVAAEEQYVIVSRLLRSNGRKHRSVAALFDTQGRLLGAADALWIELRIAH